MPAQMYSSGALLMMSLGWLLAIVEASEAAVWLVHDADEGDRRAVGSDRREGEDRFVELVGRRLAGVCRAAAADGEDHVGSLHIRIGAEGVCRFIGDVVAIFEKAGDLNIAASDACEQILFRRCHGFFATDDDGLCAVRTADIRHFFVHIAATDAIGWEEYGLRFHKNNSFD